MNHLISSRLAPALFIYLMILVSPFGFYSVLLPGGVGLTPINLVSLGLLPVALIFLIQKRCFPRLTTVGFLHLAFIAVGLVGAFFALDHFVALRGMGAYALECFLCFFYVLCFIETRDDVEKAAFCYITAGILNAIMGWVELIGFAVFNCIITPPFAEALHGHMNMKRYGIDGNGAFNIPGFMRMYGFLGDAFGPYMLVPFGICAYLFLAGRSHRKLYFFLTLFTGVTILASADRTGYVGIIFFLVTVGLFIQPTGSQLKSFAIRACSMAVVISAILGILYLLRNLPLYQSDAISHVGEQEVRSPLHLITRLNPFTSKSFATSETYFNTHWELARQFGFANFGFGLGGENFDDFVYERFPVKYGSHSNFIIFLGDNGIWGFLIQNLIVLLTTFYGIRTYLKEPGPNRDLLPLCLTGIYIGLVLSGVFRTFYLRPDSFIVIGFIIKLSELKRPLYEQRS